MKRREFVGAGLALAAAWPITGWSAVLKNVGDLAAKSLDGADLTLPGSSVEAFAASLRGDVLLPGNPEYEHTRHVWNAVFDRKPALIARCTGTSDVRHAVDFAREHQLLTAVRAGGHSFSGKSTCEGGLVIDLQSMQGVRVDPEARRAYLEAGSLLGQLDHECAAFGLATTAGTVSHTGAAGLTLGGGFGRLGRRFGLACDNVTAFDVVTANGHFIRASGDENMDLYWGLRGGGGNFGVVTAIEYRVHPMDPTILGGMIMWPIEQARDVMRFYRDIATGCTRCGRSRVRPAAGAKRPDVTASKSAGRASAAKARIWLKPLRSFGKPVQDAIAPMPYVDTADHRRRIPRARQILLRQEWLHDPARRRWHRSRARRLPANAGLYALFFEQSDAAYRRVAPDATAFPNRDAMYWLGAIGVWPDQQGMDDKVAKMRAAWRELEPLTKGFYTNLSDADATTAVYRENYGANFERLVALKAKYDPMNLFRLNANVPPKI